MVEIPAKEGKIPLLSLHRMQITLAGFPLSIAGEHVHGAQLTPDGRIMRLPYNYMVNVLFLFDRSWDDIDLESVLGGHHFVEWLRVQLAGGSNDYVTYSIPTYNGPELFLRPIFLEFHLGVVRQCLDALGIDYSPTEEDSEE